MYIILISTIIILGYIVLANTCSYRVLENNNERLSVLEEKEQTSVIVYYTTTNNRYLLPVSFDISATREVAKRAMENLLAGPPNDFVGNIVPSNTKLIDLYWQNDIVMVDVTEEIKNVAPEHALLFIDALVATILPLTEGEGLQLLIEGEVCADLHGVNISEPLNLRPINVVDRGKEGQPFVYYLSDDQAMYIIPQTIFISTEEFTGSNTTRRQAEILLLAMLKGSMEEEGLYSPFFIGTSILDISVANRVAIIDFSSRMLEYAGDAAAETMFVNCLTYTLTGLNHIDSVQILIDGEKNEYLPEGLIINEPLTADKPINYISR
jgi:spore germination protein GerM